MKYLIVSPFFNIDPNKSRPGFVAEVLVRGGNQVTVLTSSFDHYSKTNISLDGSDIGCVIKQLKTIKYRSNTSPYRFLSHFFLAIAFSWHLFKTRNDYDGYYITAPFAITLLMSAIFLKKKKIIDIVDYWPDSLPFPSNLKKMLFPVFWLWGYANKCSYRHADRVISLSSTFLRRAGVKVDSNHILHGSTKKNVHFCRENSNIHVLYVGNIGRLYDFSTLIEAICGAGLQSQYFIHVVGDGDMLEWLVEQLSMKKLKFKIYGLIFDPEKLNEIVSKCHVGFNGFNNSTASLSYKSIMYFSYGLPVINSMRGDLYDFVKDYQLGYNYEAGDVQSLIQVVALLNVTDLLRLKPNIDFFFSENLLKEKIREKIMMVFING